MTVNRGGTVDATGTADAVTAASGGTLNPALSTGSTFAAQVNGTAAGTGYSRVNVTGTVSLNNA